MPRAERAPSRRAAARAVGCAVATVSVIASLGGAARATLAGSVAPQWGASGLPEPGAGRLELLPRRLDARSWIAGELLRAADLRLDDAAVLPLLGGYAHPEGVRPAPGRGFWSGRYGPGRPNATRRLAWSTLLCDPGSAGTPAPFAPPPLALAPVSLGAGELAPERWPELAPTPAWLHGGAAPAPELLPLSRAQACAPWQRHRPATFFRHGLERDTFLLLECDGSLAAEAIDRLSVMARPLGVDRPELPLPAEPAPDAGFGEWTPGVRLVHPRLAWVMQQVADRFPYRAIYVVSGYRPGAARSQHARGRALDVQVVGVAKERLFALCRELRDVACGYYPYHDFVHLDVRERGSGHPLWVDVSRPGEPSRYVDAWPGVVDRGALEHEGEF